MSFEIFNISKRFYNVLNYGATGDGTTDDRSAIQTAINTANAAGGGEVYFPNGIYNVGTGLTTSDNNGYNPSSQLYIPSKDYNSSSRSHIVLTGETPPNFTPAGLNEDFGPSNSGVIIKSTRTTATGSVIGSAYNSGSGVNFNFNYLTVNNIAVVVADGAPVNGINGERVASLNCNNVVVTTNSSMLNTDNPLTNDKVGIKTTIAGGETYSRLESCLVSGFAYGIINGEHTVFNQVNAQACYYGIAFQSAPHSMSSTRAMTHWCKYHIAFVGGDSTVTMQNLSVEVRTGSGKWFDTTTVLYDPSNYGHGVINYIVFNAGSSTVRNDLWSVNGGTNLTLTEIPGW